MISKIAKYTVEKELGRGGFGRVYQAFDPDVKRPVAIKVLLAEADPELLKRFRLEIGTTGNLTHKNIVTLYECGENSGVPYLVMELLQGQTLQDIIKNQTSLTLLEKVQIMNQVAEGLAYAHSRGVIHRDVKPGNIMLLSDGGVKIMDFGIARVTGDALRSTDVVKTREGQIFGTVPYMAPEQFEGIADAQTDIFAYADVYYELLTGVHPFAGEGDIWGMITRIKMADPPLPSERVPDCPPALDFLLRTALAKDRELRYQRFSDIVLDNESVLAELRRDRARAIIAEVSPMIADGDLSTAEAKLREALELDAGNRDAQRLRLAIRERMHSKAVRGRVLTLLADADRKATERRYAEALEDLQTAERLDKDNPEIQAMTQRVKAARDTQTQARRMVMDAKRALQTGEWQQARELIDSALQLDSQVEEAAQLKPRIDSAWAAYLAELALQSTLETANGLVAAQRYDEALTALSTVDPHNPAVVALRQRIATERQAAEQQQRATRLQLTAAAVRSALDRNDLEAARVSLMTLTRDFASEPEAPTLIRDLTDLFSARARAIEIQRVQAEADELIRRMKFRDAIRMVEQAMRQYPDAPELVRTLAAAQQQYADYQREQQVNSLLQDARNRRASGDLAGAVQALRGGMQAVSDPALTKLLNDLEQELAYHQRSEALRQLLHTMNGLIAATRFEEAIAAGESSEYATDSEVQKLLVSARAAAYQQRERREVDAAIARVRQLEQKPSLREALGEAESALREFPHHNTLTALVQELQAKLADELFRALIARHRAKIEAAISRQLWKEASALLRAAIGETSDPAPFSDLAVPIQRALAEVELAQLTQDVSRHLQSDQLIEAARRLDETKAVHAGDPRWQALQAQLDERRSYASALAEAERLQKQGNLEGARRQLEALTGKAADTRAATMLAAVLDQQCAEALERNTALVRSGEFDKGIEGLEALRREATSTWMGRVEAAYQDALQQREIAAEQELLRRREAVAAAASAIRDDLARGNTKQAETKLTRAKAQFAGEEVWQSLAREVEEAKLLGSLLPAIEQAIKKSNFDEAEKQLAKVPAGRREEAAVQALVEKISTGRARKQADEALQAARQRLKTAKRGSDRAVLASLLEELTRQFPEGSEVVDECRQAIADLDRKQQQSQPKRETRPATVEVEVRRPLPWKPIGIGAGLAAVVAAGVALIPGIIRPTPEPQLVRIELKTDPPGASVRIDNRTCVTPTCRLELKPGKYQAETVLDGYVTERTPIEIGPKEQDRTVAITLQPIPRKLDKREGEPTVTTGELIVRSSVPGALVFLDDQPLGRSDNSGVYRGKDLPVGTHRVRVQKDGYEAPAEERVTIAAKMPKTIVVTLTQPQVQPARFELRGAPAGVEVRSGGALLGRTNATGTLAVDIPGGTRTLQFTLGSTRAELTESFTAGRVVTREWARIIPTVVKTPPVTDEQRESQEWNRIQATADTTVVEAFLSSFPNGAHRDEARRLLDRLKSAAQTRDEADRWAKVNQNDAGSLQTYLRDFPKGPHAEQARQRITDLAWNATNKKSEQELKRYLESNRNSSHDAEAQALLKELEKLRLDAERNAQDRNRQSQDAKEASTRIRATLERFNEAFQSKNVAELRRVWPRLPASIPESLKVSGASYVWMLRPQGEARVNNDDAEIDCQLSVSTTIRGKTSDMQKPVTVKLRKTNNEWFIASLPQ